MNLEIIGGQDTQPLRELWSYFDTSFRTNAVPLNPSIIAIYRKLANQIHARAKGKKSGRLWARLRAQLGSQALGSAEHARNTWFDMITGDLSKAVEARVKEETIWTGDYYSCGSKKVYEKIEPGDFLMLIKKIRNGRSFTANRVTDKTRVHTPQGDYFVAYKPQGHWRRWTFETANLARRASIPIPSEHGQARLLTREQSEMLRKGEFITKDRTNDGIYQKSFQRKLLRCDSPTKKVAYALNRFITSLNRGVVYYPGGNDVRYTHEDVPPKKNGDRHPFVHISPQIKKLAVHVDEKVKVPKNVDYVHRRNARSSFKLWFDVGGENLLNRVRRDLIQQSFRLFIKRYDLSP